MRGVASIGYHEGAPRTAGTASPGGRVNRRAFIDYSIAAVLLTPVVSITLVLLSIGLVFGVAGLDALVAILVGFGLWCGGFLVLSVRISALSDFEVESPALGRGGSSPAIVVQVPCLLLSSISRCQIEPPPTGHQRLTSMVRTAME